MKFCLSSRQTPEYLSQADEIRVLSRDIEQLFDLLESYPDKTFVYNLENLEDAEPYLKDLVKLNQNRITLALYDLNQREYCINNHFSYYYIKPVSSLSQVQALKDLGVNQILIDAPLTHMLHKVKIFGLPIRAIPTYSFLDGIPRENGVNGNWFRPEDLPMYSVYIDTIEFGTQPQKREQALFRIYAQEHEWPGDLGRLISDLNYLGVNRLLDPNYTARRMNCEMKCVENKCTLCYDLLTIASHEKELLEINERKIKEDNERIKM